MYVVFKVERKWDNVSEMDIDVCSTTLVANNTEPFLDFAKSMLGCSMVDVVGLGKGMDLWIDDEGKYAQNPPLYNVSATQFAYSNDWVPLRGDFVAGTAILAGLDEIEGETTQLDPVKATEIAKSFPGVTTFVLP
jgi:hypothetical protein